ncbi:MULTISPECIES: DUF3592 domain-containing protein [Actinosynnema]|uniref:DUF3592 domain-containing protein n=1 Tax=Actinosynnema TaxID=40566 RepID=UPI0027E25736|nr:DUF3592 domain-containing protein [Actinosynnema pretiosum]
MVDDAVLSDDRADDRPDGRSAGRSADRPGGRPADRPRSTRRRSVRRRSVRRLLGRSVLVLGALVTLVGVVLVAACWRDDDAIESRRGRAAAEVVSVSFQRTVVRYATPDGAVHSPAQGVLYPDGLEAGQVVWIEYDTDDTELARVEGRTFTLALLPVGTFLLAVWAVLGPLAWWLRRRV